MNEKQFTDILKASDLKILLCNTCGRLTTSVSTNSCLHIRGDYLHVPLKEMRKKYLYAFTNGNKIAVREGTGYKVMPILPG